MNDPRPNSPEDLGGPEGYRRVRMFEGAELPAYIDAVDRLDARCRGPHCRVVIRWAITTKDERMPLERRRRTDGAEVWEPHHAHCPDRGRFRKGRP